LNSLENNILGNKYDQIIIAPKLKKWQQYGVITISDDKSHVTSFRHNELITDEEKETYDEQYIDGGITITCHDFVDKIKGAGGFSKYMKISLSTKRVGYFVPEIWFDIGNVDSYNYTCKSSLFMTYFSNHLTYE
jgi:NDP-sugar pyrophosphorylase family protein